MGRLGTGVVRRGFSFVQIVMLAGLIASPARADTVQTIGASTWWYGYGGAVGLGNRAYVVDYGGTVHTFDSVSEQFVASRPVPVPATCNGVAVYPALDPAIVSDGRYIWMFLGGTDKRDPERCNAVIRWDPISNTGIVMSARLPTSTLGMSAIYDGSDIYLFGGRVLDVPSNAIYKYSPLEDSFTKMKSVLPMPLSDTSAIWDGSNAYIFGGQTMNAFVWNQDLYAVNTDLILKFSPSDDLLLPSTSRLAHALHDSTAVWTGDTAILFGGQARAALGSPATSTSNFIYRFKPSSGQSTTSLKKLPEARRSSYAAWTGSAAYVFGGFSIRDVGGQPSAASSIARYQP